MKPTTKAMLTSAAVTSGGWLATEAVFGFWGLIVAIPVTLGASAWLALKAKAQPWN